MKKKRAERFGLALPKEEAAPSTEAQEVLCAPPSVAVVSTPSLP